VSPRLAATLALGVALVAHRDARAAPVVLERIVAIVGDHPILLSELEKRVAIEGFSVRAQTPPGIERDVKMMKVRDEALDRLVVDTLVAQDAVRAHVSVTTDEVDAAIANIASSNKVTQKELLEQVVAYGMTEADYREVMRRAVLEQKLVYTRVRDQLVMPANATDQDRARAYERAHDAWIAQLRRTTYVEKRN
jgi:peptidyl-prolyl cis-trans isomerase SurA